MTAASSSYVSLSLSSRQPTPTSYSLKPNSQNSEQITLPIRRSQTIQHAQQYAQTHFLGCRYDQQRVNRNERLLGRVLQSADCNIKVEKARLKEWYVLGKNIEEVKLELKKQLSSDFELEFEETSIKFTGRYRKEANRSLKTRNVLFATAMIKSIRCELKEDSVALLEKELSEKQMRFETIDFPPPPSSSSSSSSSHGEESENAGDVIPLARSDKNVVKAGWVYTGYVIFFIISIDLHNEVFQTHTLISEDSMDTISTLLQSVSIRGLSIRKVEFGDVLVNKHILTSSKIKNFLDLKKIIYRMKENYLSRVDSLIIRNFIVDEKEGLVPYHPIIFNPAQQSMYTLPPSLPPSSPSSFNTFPEESPPAGMRRMLYKLASKLPISIKSKSQISSDLPADFSIGRFLFSVYDLFSNIFSNRSDLENCGYSYTLVIGNTGVGKSTLIGYLLGAKFIEEEGNFSLQLNYASKNDTFPTIGALASVTKGYQVFQRYIDTAGLLDTAGKEERIANEAAIYLATKIFLPSRLIFVLSPYLFVERGGIAILELLNRFDDILRNPEDPATFRSIGFTINNRIGSRKITKNKLIKSIVSARKILEEEMLKLIETDFLPISPNSKEQNIQGIQILNALNSLSSVGDMDLSSEASLNITDRIDEIFKTTDPYVIEDILSLQRKLEILKRFAESKFIFTNFLRIETREEIDQWESETGVDSKHFALDQLVPGSHTKFKTVIHSVVIYANDRFQLRKKIHDQMISIKSIIDEIRTHQSKMELLFSYQSIDAQIEQIELEKHRLISEMKDSEIKLHSLRENRDQLSNSTEEVLFKKIKSNSPIRPRGYFEVGSYTTKFSFVYREGIPISRVKLNPGSSNGVFNVIHENFKKGQYEAEYVPAWSWKGDESNGSTSIDIFVERRNHPGTPDQLAQLRSEIQLADEKREVDRIRISEIERMLDKKCIDILELANQRKSSFQKIEELGAHLESLHLQDREIEDELKCCREFWCLLIRIIRAFALEQSGEEQEGAYLEFCENIRSFFNLPTDTMDIEKSSPVDISTFFQTESKLHDEIDERWNSLSIKMRDHYNHKLARSDNLIEKVYSDLVLINRSKKVKTFPTIHPPFQSIDQQPMIYPADIFNGQNPVKGCVLIFGSPGIGKTSLCEMAAIRGLAWWPCFSAIFLIKFDLLAIFNYPKGPNDDYLVAEILALECGLAISELKELLNHISFREKSLLILDGLDLIFNDQLSKNQQRSLQNLLKDLQNLFDYILMTSRSAYPFFLDVDLKEVGLTSSTSCSSSSCSSRQVEDSSSLDETNPILEQNICPTYEMMGFDDNSIEEYIESYFREFGEKKEIDRGLGNKKGERLSQELSCHPIFKTLARNPKNLTLLCSIFKEHEDIFGLSQGYSLFNFLSLTIKKFKVQFLASATLSFSSSSSSSIEPLDSRFDSIHASLQLIAWIGMTQSITQFSKKQVNDVLVEKGASYQDFEKTGIMDFKGGSWIFLDYAYQEYYAGLYLASLYFKEQLCLAEELIIQVKFNPLFTPALRMTVGYLSPDTNLLDHFFDHFIKPPHDLSEKYERCLLAQLFEGCPTPQIIRQYPAFVEACAQYVKTEPFEEALVSFFNQNVRLLYEDRIVESILLRMKEKSQTSKILFVLSQLSSKASFHPQLVNCLLDCSFSMYDVNIRKCATDILLCLGERKVDFLNDSTFSVLRRIIGSDFETSVIKENAILILGSIGKFQEEHSAHAVDILTYHFVDPNLDDSLKLKIISILNKISQEKRSFKEIAERALENSVFRDLRSRGVNHSVLRRCAEVAIGGSNVARPAQKFLKSIMMDTSLGNDIRCEAISYLIQAKGSISENTMKFLDQEMNSKNDNKSIFAMSAYMELIRGGCTLSEKRVNAFITNVVDNLTSHNRASSGLPQLETLVEEMRIFPPAAIKAVIKLIKNPLSSDELKCKGMKILGKIVELEGGGVIHIIALLIEVVRDANFSLLAKNHALLSIKRIVKHGKLPHEMLPSIKSEATTIINDSNSCPELKDGAILLIGEILLKMTSDGELDVLYNTVIDLHLSTQIRVKIISILQEILKQESERSKTATKILVSLMIPKIIAENSIGKAIFSTLKDIVKIGCSEEESKLALNRIYKMNQENKLDKHYKSILPCLGEIASGRGKFSVAAMSIFEKMIDAKGKDEKFFELLISTLENISLKVGYKRFMKINTFLKQMMANKELNPAGRDRAALAIIRLAKRKESVDPKALSRLEKGIRLKSPYQKLYREALSELSPDLLIKTIENLVSLELVIKICFLTSKAFILNNDHVFIIENKTIVSKFITEIETDTIISYARTLKSFYAEFSLEDLSDLSYLSCASSSPTHSLRTPVSTSAPQARRNSFDDAIHSSSTTTSPGTSTNTKKRPSQRCSGSSPARMENTYL